MAEPQTAQDPDIGAFLGSQPMGGTPPPITPPADDAPKPKDPGPDVAPKPGLSAEGRIDDLIRKHSQETDQTIGALKDLATRQAGVNQPIAPPALPRLNDIPKAPNYELRSGFEAFKNPLVWAALLGSAFARRPAVAAMAAATGAIQGFEKGDHEMVELQRQKFKDSVDATIAQNNKELAQYNAALTNKNFSANERAAQVAAIAAATNNTVMQDAARRGDTAFQYQAWTDLKKITDNLEERKREFDLRLEEQRNRQAETERHNVEMEGIRAREAGAKEQNADTIKAREKRIAETNNGTGALSAEDKTYLAKQYNLIGQEALRGLGWRGAAGKERAEIMAEARAQAELEGKGPGDIVAQQADIKAERASLTTLVAQQHAITQFENTARKNGAALLTLAQKVDKSGVPVVEAWTRAGRRATGDPDVSAFNAQMQAYRTEVARILTNPNLKGVLTNYAQREADKFISSDSSFKQLKVVVALLNQDFDRRASSLKQEIDAARATIGGRQPAAPAAPAAPPAGDTGGWSKP